MCSYERDMDLMYELTSLDVTKSKESNVDVTVHGPLLSFTVWAAAVIHEASGVSLWTGVYHTVLHRSVVRKSTLERQFNYVCGIKRVRRADRTLVRVSM